MSSSIDRSVDCEIHPEANEATVTVSREISVEDLFNDDGELRLWEDYAGWNGYFRDDDGRLWEVNCQSENPLASERSRSTGLLRELTPLSYWPNFTTRAKS